MSDFTPGTVAARSGGRLPCGILRLTALAVVYGLTAACASHPADPLLAVGNHYVMGCPEGSTRTCEVTGGNKFKKRYGRCACWRQ